MLNGISTGGAGRAPARPRGPATRTVTPAEARFRRIRRGVVGLSFLVVALAIAIGVQSSLKDREERLEDARSDAMATARTVERHVAGLLDSNGQYLFDLRTDIEDAGGVDALDRSRLERLLRAPRLHDQATRRAFVVDAAGARYGSEGDAPPGAPARQPYFLHHLEKPNRGLAVGTPFPSAAGGDWVMPLSVRLDGPDGRFAGVAVLSFDVEYLLGYFRSLGLDPEASIALIDSDGRFFLRHPRFEEAVGLHVERAVTPYPGTAGALEATSTVDGEKRLVAYHRVGDYPLYAVVTVPRGEILDAWMRSSFLRVAIAGAVIGVMALFTLLLVARLDSERLAQASLAQFQRAVDHAGDLLYWVAEDGRIVYLNEVAARRFAPDLTRAPAGLSLHAVVAGYDPASWARLWEELRARGTARWQALHRTQDGATYPVELSASYLEVDGAGHAFLIGRELREG